MPGRAACSPAAGSPDSCHAGPGRPKRRATCPDGSRIGGWLGVALGVLAGLGVALGLDQAAEPAGAQAEAVQVTAAQLLINQRISQAGVKRSNEALGLLAPVRPRGGSTPPGWPTAALAEGSVTFGKLADGAVRGAKLGDGAVSERHLSDELKVATGGAGLRGDRPRRGDPPGIGRDRRRHGAGGPGVLQGPVRRRRPEVRTGGDAGARRAQR